MEKYKTDLEELESKIFHYFLSEFETFIGDDDYDYFQDALDGFYASDYLNSSLRRSFYVDDFFKPELGISLKLLLSILKENNTTFKDYIKKILLNNNVKKELERDGFRFAKEKNMEVKDMLINEGLLDSVVDKVSDSTIKAVKNELIKKESGIEDLNTENLDDEELDTLLAKLTTINEKVDAIVKKMRSFGCEAVARAIANYTGMHLSEAKEIVADIED